MDRREGQVGPFTRCAILRSARPPCDGQTRASCPGCDQVRVERKLSKAMDDPYDLVLGMLAVAITAVMLVAGELYLVVRSDKPEAYKQPPSVLTSSIK
jgi:hypothetical protein